MLLFNEVVEVGDRSEWSEEVRPNCSLRETEDQVRCEEQQIDRAGEDQSACEKRIRCCW